MRTIRGSFVAITALVVFAVTGAPAQADVTLGGYNSFQVLAAGDGGFNPNVYEVTGDLTLSPGASINCNDNATDQPSVVIVPNSSACPISITVSNNLVMEAGSAIKAENLVSGGNGGNISIIVRGNVTLSGGAPAGAVVSSSKISGAGDTGIGGNIAIRAGDAECTTQTPEGGDILVDLGAQILADSPGNAGDIAILSGRNMTIRGKVSSNNSSTVGRAGTITIIACCQLLIDDQAVVSSRGHDPGADLVHLQGCCVVIRGLVESIGAGHNDAGAPGSSLCNDGIHVPPVGYTKFRACVEIWSGSTLTIDASDPGHNGQVVAEATKGQDNSLNKGSSWIDLYANGDITINGNAIEPFAVHANANQQNTGRAGIIAIKSKGGDVNATNLAVQADSTPAGGKGGDILIEAALDIDLDTAKIYARGDFVATGGYGVGGKETIRAYTGSLSWTTAGIGDVQPTGATIAAASRGVILLFGCGVNTTGSTFPSTGASTMPPAQGCPGGAPTIANPANTALIALEDCEERCGDIPPLPPPPPDYFCVKDPVRTILDNASGRYPLNQGPDVVVRVDLGESIQAAITAAAVPGYDAAHNGDGYIIIAVSAKEDGMYGGHTTQSIHVSDTYELPFALFGCSVTMHDPTPNDGVPTAKVESFASSPEYPLLSGQNMFFMDLHAADSKGVGGAGWKVEGNGRYLRNTYGTNSTTGIWFVGNNNVMHNGKAEGNTGIGIKVEGHGNVISGPDAMSNGGDGVSVAGDGNVLDGIDSGEKGQGNVGNGVVVSGNGNQLIENDAFANGKNGFLIASTLVPNLLKKNGAGDKGKGNLWNGIVISGNGTGAIDLDENTVKANSLNGIWLTGSNHKLKNNKSGGSGAFPGGEDNGDYEFLFGVGGNLDGGGNKSNNANMTSFTAGGKGTP